MSDNELVFEVENDENVSVSNVNNGDSLPEPANSLESTMDGILPPWVQRYPGVFQTPFPPKSPHLYGHIEASVLDSGVAPNTVIKVGDDWYVDIYWSLKGTLMPLIYGKWCIRLHLESMGRGKEFNYPRKGREIYVRANPCGNGYYRYRVKVPAGTVTAKHHGIPYKLVVSVTFYDYCGEPGRITGVVEGPILYFS
ncbi:hypothetical protein [Candidatus Leptofilum sp.]|uniref:hypothetical protein n=1 Tax=Candidatus Leptofilum sp. TaxID=3241576 RepID=UPI003B5979EB